MYNKDKCHNNTRVNLMTKKNGDTTEKDFPKQSGNYAPEIRNKETGGMYYNHSTIYKKEPDPFDSVKPFDNIKMKNEEQLWEDGYKECYPDVLKRGLQGELFCGSVRDIPAAKEKVNHPDHYNAGKIEVIDAIEDWGLDFIEGNVVKYITRAKHKGNTLGDLRKARWYLDYRIAELNDKKE